MLCFGKCHNVKQSVYTFRSSWTKTHKAFDKVPKVQTLTHIHYSPLCWTMLYLLGVQFCLFTYMTFYKCSRWSVQVCVNWQWEVSSMRWAWSSLRAMALSLSPTPSGIFSLRQEHPFIITPSGGTCTYLGHCCRRRGD